ncbi:AXL2 [[Candida] subhashii]|uniref:AXL2 n=1 Tax=[Candida] subhashii TaxID=561895 RepID=A0A8J5UQK7_9ASCO|nr:AXL2 [[Candida] subhashii]KAG7664157.1 AXL2 [[Candida] subhashii]
MKQPGVLSSVLLLLLTVTTTFINAQVSVEFPFDQQLPDVARVGQPYSFTMAPNTYKSDIAGAVVNYSVQNLPDWLSFDPASTTFSGTPSVGGEFQIVLIGTDSVDGTTLSNSYNMMASQDPGPKLASDTIMVQEIQKYGGTDGNGGLVVSEGQVLNIQFDKSVFVSNEGSQNPIVAYYGRSSDRTPLPVWITFNADDLSFTGTVPQATSENAPSVAFTFSLIASDYYDFAGAEGLFRLQVGAHQLSTNIDSPILINATANEQIDEDIPVLTNVILDGQPISKENVGNVSSSDLPSYLNLDTENFKLTGTLPADFTDVKFTIKIQDIYQNDVDLAFEVKNTEELFAINQLPNVNATKGEFFDYQLEDSFFTNHDQTTVTIEQYDASWLTYHQDNKTFTGIVPDDFDKLDLTIVAEHNGITQTKGLSLLGINKEVLITTSSSESSSSTKASSTSHTSSSATTTSATTTSSEPSATNTSEPSKEPEAKDTALPLKIGLGVAIPVAVAICAILVFFFCIKRKKSTDKDQDLEKNDQGGNQPSPYMPPTISGPQNVHSSAMNFAKMDQVKTTAPDTKSTSSSITHVESDYGDDEVVEGSSHEHTAIPVEQPIKSWRANSESDYKNGDMYNNTNRSKDNRVSAGSMDTVNTEQLFSVRLVEDPEYRNSVASSHYLLNNDAHYANDNIQRLDSDGNIIATLNGRPPSGSYMLYQDQQQQQRSGPQPKSNNPFLKNATSEGSIGNLLAQVNEQSSSTTMSSSASYTTNNDDVVESRWQQDQDHSPLPNPTFRDDQSSYYETPIPSAPASSTRENFFVHDDGGNKNGAKLVEFTRKGSLKQAARANPFGYREERAQIQDDDSD